MARCLGHHEQLNEHGVGKCSVPMFCGMGTPAGFCDEDAYGKPLPPPKYESLARRELRQSLYVPSLACPGHGGPKQKVVDRIFKDGNQWCAVRHDFINLMESPAGFGDTQEQAIKALCDAAQEQSKMSQSLKSLLAWAKEKVK